MLDTMEEIEAEVEKQLAYYRSLRDSLERACVYLEVVDQLASRASGYQRGETHKAVVDLDREASIYGQASDWMPTIELERSAGEYFKRVYAIKDKIERVRRAQEWEGKTHLRLTQKLDMIERVLEKADACFLGEETKDNFS